MLQARRESQITFLQSPALEHIPRIVHGFSTRRAERRDFSLGPAPSENPAIQSNRARFLAALGAPGWPILKLRQTHSAIVQKMDDTLAAGDAVEGDASITMIAGAMLGVQTADCVPILIADSQARAVAAVHAGWRGASARIAELTVARLIAGSGIQPANLIAVIGPHIGVCCYEVGEDVVSSFQDSELFERRSDWLRPHLNLAEANRPDGQIVVSSLCTQCRDDLFFSYRREGETAGRMLSVIGIVP
jgi:YfiH family protein